MALKLVKTLGKIPHYDVLLHFLDLRAQASEICSSEPKKCHPPRQAAPKSATSFAANAQEGAPNCFLCKTQKHPLYACLQFKPLPHDKMLSTIRSSNVCLNGLKPGHFSKSCRSNNRCRKCQSHTTLCCTRIQSQLQRTIALCFGGYSKSTILLYIATPLL